MYKEYHDKHVLVTGQGPIYDIARQLGFRKVTTMKTLRHVFPSLDAVDHKRRRAAPWDVFIQSISYGCFGFIVLPPDFV